MLRWLLYAVFVVIGWVVLSHLASILAPIVIAFGIAYLLDPVLDRLVRAGMSRAVGATLLLVLFIGTVVGMIIFLAPRIAHEVTIFVEDMPRMADRSATWVA